MSRDDDLFFEACGLTAPLELEWDDWETAETVRRKFNRPALLVGRNPRGDLTLDHPDVSKRHAYLQVIEGRLHAIDLESRDGIRWSGVPRRSGWIDRGRPMRLGPTAFRVVGDAPVMGPLTGPGPLSSRFVSRHSLPDVVLEIRDGRGQPTRLMMDRVLMLVGSSPLCKITLPGGAASRFACALVRTPSGIWMVDLLSSHGVTVNGVACRDAWLDDRDLIQVGDETIRLIYGASAAAPHPSTSAGSNRPNGVAMLPSAIGPASGSGVATAGATGQVWELIPEMILRQLPDRDGPLPEAASAPFNQALLMLIRLLGEMHRDHLDVVRDEMEQIRRLNQEMTALRSELPQPSPTAAPDDGRSRALESQQPEALPTRAVDSPQGRLDPQDVQTIVGKRLAAWEKERQSRWRKVMDLLIKP